MGVFYPERHAADTGSVFFGKKCGVAFRFFVKNEIDLTLAVQTYLFGPVFGDRSKTQHVEYGFQQTRGRGCELDKLKAVQAHRVVKQICHY